MKTSHPIRRATLDPAWPEASAAVKQIAGMVLRRMQCNYWLDKIRQLRHSPGGRPVALSLTPKELVDSYMLLAPEAKREFLSILGKESPAEAAVVFNGSLEPIERERFTDIMTDQLSELVFPVCLAAAREVAQSTRNLSDDDFEKMIHFRLTTSTKEFSDAIGEREAAKLKAKRDRKPELETILRNVEICDLRNKDARHWSQGRLAKKYGLTERAIRKILKDETKWRRLAEQGGPTS